MCQDGLTNCAVKTLIQTKPLHQRRGCAALYAGPWSWVGVGGSGAVYNDDDNHDDGSVTQIFRSACESVRPRNDLLSLGIVIPHFLKMRTFGRIFLLPTSFSLPSQVALHLLNLSSFLLLRCQQHCWKLFNCGPFLSNLKVVLKIECWNKTMPRRWKDSLEHLRMCFKQQKKRNEPSIF